MLSISHPMKSAAAAVEYYANERKADYYLNGIDQEGRWFGGAATRLGVGQTVQREQFLNLLNGFTPDGREPLVQNAGKEGRQACWDMTFNAPKSVSVLWAVSPPVVRQQLETDHRESVETALRVAEEIGGIVRSGPGGKVKERAGLLWATFQEGTSRAQDPHLHTHAVLINLGCRENGRCGAISTANLFRWKLALGSIYQAELSSRLAQAHGLASEPEKVGFGLRGVPQAVCQGFSKRRQTIEAAMEQGNLAGAVAAKTVAKATRPHKEEVAPDQLFPRWLAEAEGLGWGREQARQLLSARHQSALAPVQFDQRVQQTVQALPPEKQARAPLVRAAARVAFEHGADGQTLFQSLAKLTRADGGRVLWQPRWPDRVPVRTERRPEDRVRQELRQSKERAGQRVNPDHRPPIEAGPTDPEPPRSTRSPSGEPTHRPSPPTRQAIARPSGEQVPSERSLAGGAVRPATHPAKDHQPETREAARPREQPSPPEAQANRGSRAPRHSAPPPSAEEYHRGKPERAPSQGHRQGPSRPAEEGKAQRGARHERMPERKGFVRVEWRRLFPNAPGWSPASKLTAPVIVVGHRDPRWRRVRWRKDLKLFEVRVQDRVLFRHAPKWSPFHGLTAPTLRFAAGKSQSQPMKRLHQPKRPGQQRGQTKDHGHSH